MEKTSRIEAYFEKESPFREGLRQLREIVLQTELYEDLKWGAPVYTLGGKNVLGVLSFKQHFGLWFFNGVFLSDPLGVLDNVQEGKTKAMRHWKFSGADQIDPKAVLSYVQEAIRNERKGKKLAPEKPRKLQIPDELKSAFDEEPKLKEQFNSLTAYKKRDYAEYISTAKQAATRERRLRKILPMIRQGIGLNDQYRNC